MEQRRIAVLVNKAAGKGKAKSIAEKVAGRLRYSDIPMELYCSQWPTSLNQFTDVFLIGGDGTLNYFINRYSECQLPVSLFAAGSGNDFSWKLNGKQKWEDCFDTAWNGKVILVDAGICNNRYFINGVGIGFDGQVVKTMGRKRFISAGHFAYLFTVLKEILFYKSIPVKVSTDAFQYCSDIFMISVANGSRYGGGFMVAPEASINDGLLDIVTVNRLSVAARLKYLPAIEKGKHMHLSFMKSDTCTHVRIESNCLIPAHLDGEPIEAAAFDIRILSGHFRFRTNKVL
jgi:YegS/Rv2252/BmrU family lipid kinase